MSARERWINGDDAFLRSIAQQIAEDDSLRCVSVEDRTILSTISSAEGWASLATTEGNEDSSENINKTGSEQNTVEDMDALTSLFRSRSLIYENCIYSDLFLSGAQDHPSLVSPYIVQSKAKAAQDEKQNALDKEANRRVRSEEDDYDEDEDEPSTPVKPAKDISDQSLSIAQVPSGGTAARKIDVAMENRKNEDAILQFEIDGLYHTLEYDRHALLEQNTLEASDRRVEAESGALEKEKVSAVNFGAASLSLKHLISKIDQSREKLAMSDNELRVLLSEVRKNRSKWANEEKVGQEELYEAAERVVLELRGYTEHSTAFLNKVTKRDVPDYYNIIKEPMDLGTLMKNLKNLVYKSKAEFTRDVMLIWDNCLTYNADAAHPLRKHAYAMRRKSEQLLAMVPDVVIRDRADLEAEEFGLMDVDQEDDDEEDKKPIAGKSTRGTFGGQSKKAKKSMNNSEMPSVFEDNDGDETTIVKMEDPEHEGSRSPERIHESHKTIPGDTEDAGQETERTNGPLGSDLEEVEETNPSFQVWRTRTKKLRAKYAGARQKRIFQESLQSDGPALRVNPSFLANLGESCIIEDGNTVPSINDFDESPRTGANDHAQMADHILLHEYEICSVPEPATMSDELPPADATFQVQDTLLFEPPAGGMIDKVRATTLEMKSIRRLCTKLSTLKLMQDPTMSAFPASYFRQLMESDTPLKFEPIEINQSGFDVEPCGEELARSLLQRSSTHLLYQAGFEDFQPQALTCFAEVAGEFIQTIGRLMKGYAESRQALTAEEILRHSLFEVGIPDLGTLDDYVAEEIDSKSEKILALHDRLKKFLNDFIQGTVDGENSNNNLFDENNRDAFLSGSFGEETGEDFFGFRELGLDKEFGMSSLSVPLRLLQGRLRPTSSGSVPGEDDGVTAVRFDRRFPHMTKEIVSRQIGIFRPFLETRFALLAEDEECPYLVEDEDLPMRQRKPKPRLGPTGKIMSAMKRAQKDPHTISPKKKKKMDRDLDGGGASPVVPA